MDNLLRDKFLSFEGDIPMSDWFAIEQKLDKKRRFGWIWWAAMPLLIIAGLGLYTLFHYHNSGSTITKTNSTNLKSNNEVVIEENAVQPEKAIEPNNFIERKESNNRTIKSKNPFSNELDTDVNTNEIITKSSIFESISLSSKLVNNFWNYSSPVTEKLKAIELTKPFIKNPSIFNFEVGINFAPAAGLDALSGNNIKMLNRSYFSSIAGSSSFGSGFNQGIHAQLNFGKNWFFRQGIYRTTYNVFHNYEYTIKDAPRFNTKANEIVGYDSLLPWHYEHIQHSGKATIQYISLPLIIGNRVYINKKMGIESKLGYNLSLLYSSDGQTVNPTYLTLESINSNNSIKKWNSGISISTGWFYKPINNLIFTVEPNFSTTLGSARIKNYPVKTRYYNYGINVNINYILGNK